MVRHVTLLATAVKLPTPLVDETCVALNSMLTSSVLSDLSSPELRTATASDRVAAPRPILAAVY